MDDVAGEDAPAVTIELLDINSDAIGFRRWPLPEADVDGAFDVLGLTTDTIVG